jgi:hypothetical protein
VSSKTRYLADLLGEDGDVKFDKFDSGAQADLSNVGELPLSIQLQLKGEKGDDGSMTPSTEDILGIYTSYKS